MSRFVNAWVFPALILGATLGNTRADESAGDEASIGALVADEARGEVRLPCRFVNPSRVLEVFACHRSGPTHETVVEFDATGPEIDAALRAVGCRSASEWNITGPDDFVKTQGDRLLVLIRWDEGGRRREYAAEAMLTDGGFGFPAFVRGFSYGARRRPVPPSTDAATEDEDSPDSSGAPDSGGGAVSPDARPTIPEVVEVTLGGTTRRSPTFSLIWHATTSATLQRWMLPPVVNPAVVEDMAALVEQKPRAMLVLRRVRSERELLQYLRSVAATRGLADRASVYDAAQPLAERIDSRKSSLRQLARELEQIVAGAAGRSESDAGASGERVLELLKRGRLLVEEIEAAYLEVYRIQEEHKVEWLAQRPAIDVGAREEALVLARGFSYEPRIASKRVALARLDVQGVAPAGLQRRALEREIDVLGLERDREIVDANLRYVERRLAATDPEDEYLRELFEGDRFRMQVERRSVDARLEIARTDAAELRARHGGKWGTVQKSILSRRTKARSQLELAELEKRLADVLEELRWARNDLESSLEDRRVHARANFEKFTVEKRELEAKIDAARKASGTR